MNEWQETNTRGFSVSLNDEWATTVTIQGPNLTAEEAVESLTSRWPHKNKSVASIEEYTYEDTVKREIERSHKQISICLERIRTLESRLETV